MRTRVVLWALVVGVAGLVAPGALTAVVQGGTGPAADAEPGTVRPVASGDASPSGSGGNPTTPAPSDTAATGPSAAATGSGAGGGNGRCNPYCSDPNLIPPPYPTIYDPFANCPHRWQVEQTTGRLIDTGCASEPQTPVVVETVPRPPPPPPILLPEQPTTTTTIAPPPPPPPPPDPPTTDTTIAP